MIQKQRNSLFNKESLKAFFHGESWKKALIFFTFLLISFSFWLLQYLQQKFEIDIKIPVKYINVPQSVSIEDTARLNLLKIRVSDRGTVLLNYTISREMRPIVFDFKRAVKNKDSFVIPRENIEKEIYSRLASTTNLVSYYPSAFSLSYKALMKKRVPVVIKGSVATASGYMLSENLRVDPSYIYIYGSEDNLASVNRIYTENIDETELNKSERMKVNLIKPHGLTLSQNRVEVLAKVEEYTEKVLSVPVVCDSLPEDYIVRIFPSNVEVTCQVVLSRYNMLTNQSVVASIRYADVVNNRKTKVQVKLSQKPFWLNNYRISPEYVEFLLEKKTGF